KHRSDIKKMVDICIRRLGTQERRDLIFSKICTQIPDAIWLICAFKSEYPPSSVGFYHMTQLQWFGIGIADNRRRVKPHSDPKASGKVLMCRGARQQRTSITGCSSRRKSALLDEVFLEICRIDAVAIIFDGPRSL